MNKIIILGALLLSGCSTFDNYQFGDITTGALESAGKIISLKKSYCSEKSEDRRELILVTIRLADPDYKGFCNDEN